MATLTITHTESLTLGDGDGTDRGSTNVQTLTVSEVDHRIVTVGTTPVDFLKFGVMPGAGIYKDGTVKYLRITNLDATNFIHITVRQSDAEYCVKLEAEGSDEGTNSFTLGPTVMDAHEDGDTGTSVAPTFANIDSITLGADTAACKVEIFVAATS